MSTGGSTMSFWIKFFSEAGIPAGIAANYAVMFTEHRIQEDMLLDLSKEYLSDMGVTTLGDVIAILRHAKAVHAKSTREKALKSASTVTTSATSSPKRSTPASRTVNHYIGSNPEARPMSEASPVPSPKISAELASRLGSNTPTASPVARVKISKKVLTEEVPVPKIRRVLPEHEGRYKIIMPKGTTAKTKKILEGKAKVTDSSSSVFARLGQGSADTIAKTSSSGQKITVTGLDKVSLAGSSTVSSSSVFGRLGGKTTEKRAASSTCPDPEDSDEEVVTSPLEYAGVLKASTSDRKQALLAKKRALIAQRKKMMERKKRLAAQQQASEVSTSSEGLFAKETFGGKVSLLQRLGKQQIATSTTGGVTQTPGRATKLSKGISMRATTSTKPGQGIRIQTGSIGGGQLVNYTISKDLSSRLGPQKATVSSSGDVPKKKKTMISLKRKNTAEEETVRKRAATTTSTKKWGVFDRLGKAT